MQQFDEESSILKSILISLQMNSITDGYKFFSLLLNEGFSRII